MNIGNGNFASIESMRQQLAQSVSKESNVREQEKQTLSFEEVLSKKRQENIDAPGGIRFSKHANDRLACRNIDLSKEQMERLEYGMNRAREKGILTISQNAFYGLTSGKSYDVSFAFDDAYNTTVSETVTLKVIGNQPSDTSEKNPET